MSKYHVLGIISRLKRRQDKMQHGPLLLGVNYKENAFNFLEFFFIAFLFPKIIFVSVPQGLFAIPWCPTTNQS
jgi:hypothetical protein